jgi:hypothetical protein
MARKAAKALNDDTSSKLVKSLAGGVLSQTVKPNKEKKTTR